MRSRQCIFASFVARQKKARCRRHHLNLPLKILYHNGSFITYQYDAAGTKVRKLVSKQVGSNQEQTTTVYQQDFQYENNTLQFISHPEGYIKATKVGNAYQFNYVYQYKDHLGNIRMNYALDPSDNQVKILNEDHYYPFGLKHTNYNSNVKNFQEDPGFSTLRIIQVPSEGNTYRYKFQGQERQDELGLNWDSFKYRNYDYAIGRFMNIDPLAEKYNTWSPYAFSGNRVIDARELEGLEPVVFQSLFNADKATNPNGVSAHLSGFAHGIINSVKNLFNAIIHPIKSGKGFVDLSIASAANHNAAAMIEADYVLGTNSFGTSNAASQSFNKSVSNLVSGNGQQRGEVVGEVAGAIVGAKGVNVAVEGIGAAVSVGMENAQTTTVFRVFGGDAKAGGFSWTTENPYNVSNYRNAAGLPSGGASGSTNTGQFVIEGTVKNSNIIKTRSALPLDGNAGGLPELIINPKNVKVNSLSMPNPPF